MEALKVGTKLVNLNPDITGIMRVGREFTVAEVVVVAEDDAYFGNIGPFIYRLSNDYQCDHNWLSNGGMEVVE